MEFVIKDGTIKDKDKYSIKELIKIMEELDSARMNLMFTTIRIIKSKSDLKDTDPEWLKTEVTNIGRNVLNNSEIGTFIGIEETFEDFYYIIKKDDSTTYETCVSKLDYID